MRGARILKRGQQVANDRMSETVAVGSFEDSSNETGDAVRVLVEQRYPVNGGVGAARLRLSSQNVTNAEAPSMPLAVQEPTLSVPWGSPRLLVGDEVLCVTSIDPVLVGRRFRIQGNAQSGQTTAHRYPLQEIT